MDSVPWLTLKCCSIRAVGWEQVQIESFVVIISCDLSNKALFGRSVVRAGLANPHQTFPAIYTRHALEFSSVRAVMGHATSRPSRCAKVYKPVGTVGLFCSVCLHSYQEPARLRVSGLALSAQVKLLVPPTPLAPTYPQRDCWRGVVGEKQPARPGSRFVSSPPTSPSVFCLCGQTGGSPASSARIRMRPQRAWTA